MQIKFLGTSSMEAIPREGCECKQCASKDLKDKRLRSSILIDKEILIDVGPDILKQLTPGRINNLEMVLITHEHQDHSGGLKDILHARRDLKIIKLAAGQHFKWRGIDFHAFKVRHSTILPTVGIEIANLIYIPDYADLDFALKYISEAEIAILDGSVLGRSFNGHFSINETIAETKNLKNLKKIYFTHNGHTKKTHKEMTELVQTAGDERYEIAYDGLEIEI